MSYETAKELGLIWITVAAIRANDDTLTTDQITKEYPKLFQGLGKLHHRQVKIYINTNITPVAQPHRRIPFHLGKKVVAELEDPERKGIIEKVEGPTLWVSPIAVASKPHNLDKICLCIDMRQANQAIKRERDISPTTDDIIQERNRATIFSELDLNQGYHQLGLEPESRYVTFSEPHWIEGYTCLNFGISSAAEVFQATIHQVIAGIPGALNISADIIVHGDTREHHDKTLCAVLNRLQDHNPTLNKDKCAFHKTHLHFFGNIFTKAGMSPDPQKVKAVKDTTPPHSVSEVRSFLGMTSYCLKYIPDYATITAPLKKLARKSLT